MGIAAILISLLSLAIAATTLWLTYLRRGHLRMTTPAIVFFGYDFAPTTTPKIFLRTLLYSTSNQGQLIENMYVKVRSESREQLFSFWGYGETEKIVAGSGLYIGRSGVAANHHFVHSVHEAAYEFRSGRYAIEVYARVVGRAMPLRLGEIEIALSEALATGLSRHDGVLFELKSDGQGYIGHLGNKP